MLSSYLIWTSSAYFGIGDYTIYKTFLIISAIFAVLAVVFFFLRKEQSSTLTT
jgi:asparagine N-glycosylation enzyme membrane subunit Stt3